MTAARRYRAFISYSHADRKWASWLLRSLETWRVPRHLVGQHTRRGEIPARLGPIFADREELSATDDLRASLQAALVQSDALIVICSPIATRSPWVEQEILYFRAVHPDGLILALIVAGDPAATDIDLQCFPRALLCQPQANGSWSSPVYEPVAADARPQADGRYRAKMKLIAGLLAVDLDNLLTREHQRQQRKWIAMATASLIGMAVMSTLTVFAFKARNEAELRHAQAEGLIEFMLTELRQKLEPVGRLDALQVVAEKAMDYYNKESPDTMQADALGRRQRVMHLLGEIQELRGNLDEAFASFQQAAGVTAELLARDPENPQRVFDHAQSEFWVGYIALQRHQLAEASAHFERYRDLAGQFATLNPKDAQGQTELAYANQSLGIVALQQQHYQSALRYLSVTTKIFNTLQNDQPDAGNLLYETGQAYAWLADASEAAWQFAEAEQHRRSELKLYESMLAAEPTNSLALSGSHVCYRKLATLALNRGDLAKAATLLQHATNLIDQLIALEPDSTLLLEMKGRTQLKEVELLVATAAIPSKIDSVLSDARQLISALTARDNSVSAWDDLQLRLRYHEIRQRAHVDQATAMREYQDLLTDIDRLPPHRRSGHDTLELTLTLHNAIAQHVTAQPHRQTHWQAAVDALPTNIELSPYLQQQLCRAAAGLDRQDLLDRCQALLAAGFRHPEFVAVMAHTINTLSTATASPTPFPTR